jgi:hypothetical protein
MKMVASTNRFSSGTYNNGHLYKPARGRYGPRPRLEDYCRQTQAVIDLGARPSASKFLRAIVREMKIRFYQPKTVKAYRNALRLFLRWYRGRPHQVTREDVRCYLEFMVSPSPKN